MKSNLTMRSAAVIANVWRMVCLMLMASALLIQPALAQTQPGGGIIATAGNNILQTVAQVAGVIATIGGVIVGIRVVYHSMIGSSRNVAEAVVALLGVAFGIALIAGGPHLAKYIYENLGVSDKGVQVPPIF